MIEKHSDGVQVGAAIELKFDSVGTITGTAIFRRGSQEIRAPIKTGTFDPTTRAFRLEGEAELFARRRERRSLAGSQRKEQ